MLNRFKSALYNVVGNVEGSGGVGSGSSNNDGRAMPIKFPYRRPSFLQFATDEEMMVSADHSIRPIIVPRDIGKLPWRTGYAETINAGKSVRNEDQAAIHVGILRGGTSNDAGIEDSNHANCLEQSLPYFYFALFDGHAGAGAAVAASNTLHLIVHEKLLAILDLLLELTSSNTASNGDACKPTAANQWFPEKQIDADSLIIGALESAFAEMDSVIERDRLKYKMHGGCTALVALFMLGKLYLANAGDSRAIICRDENVIPMSFDFTPESEHERIRQLAMLKPELLGNDYTALEFSRRPVRKDVSKKLLYREPYMNGWAYKTVTYEDLKFPLIYGEGKRSRVLATIGVTRGFGDHDLKAQTSSLNIKPFLTPHPEVRIYDVVNEDISDNDVLVMGTDGLWDITTNDRAAEIISKALDHFSKKSDSRYRFRFASAAQELVMNSRGKLKEKSWKTGGDKPATIDDITVFVIPLLGYKEDYTQWLEAKSFVAVVNRDTRDATPTAAIVTFAEEAKEQS